MPSVAGVVTFNPDLALLRRNLDAIHAQVDAVLVVDNASAEGEGLADLCRDRIGVTLHRNSVNRGMASALNQIMEWAALQGADWAVLLDQDSVATPGLVRALSAQLEPNVGQVAARIVDRNIPSTAGPGPPRDIDHCITSGSLCRLAAWEQLGGYDEQLFVDFVDFDFCLRLRMAGWRIRSATDALLSHEVGHARRHGSLVAYHHSASRSYHVARDMVVYARKHRRSPRHLKVKQRGLPMTCAIIVRRAVVVALFEQDRCAKVWALLTGMAAGLTVPLRERA